MLYVKREKLLIIIAMRYSTSTQLGGDEGKDKVITVTGREGP
jgi:hypothetical protein